MSNQDRLSRDIKDAEKAIQAADGVISREQGIIRDAQEKAQAIRQELAEATKIAQERMEGLQARMVKSGTAIQEAFTVKTRNEGILAYTRKAFEELSKADGPVEANDVASGE